MSNLHGILNNYIHELRNTPSSQSESYVTENNDAIDSSGTFDVTHDLKDHEKVRLRDLKQMEDTTHGTFNNFEKEEDRNAARRELDALRHREKNAGIINDAKHAANRIIKSTRETAEKHPYATGAGLTAAAIAAGAGALALRKKLKEKKAGKK